MGWKTLVSLFHQQLFADNSLNAALKCPFASRKLLPTSRHRAKRMKFAHKCADENEDFWRKILFSDETRVAT